MGSNRDTVKVVAVIRIAVETAALAALVVAANVGIVEIASE